MNTLPDAPLVSVIIANYNYAEFVGAAIDSALNLDWARVEVIVVDDGSSDESRAVIERYQDRITALFQANAGQLVATNRAFAISRGEIVILLDADDLLHPTLMREVMRVWTSATSKVQVQMQTVDAQGRSLGTFLPQYNRVPTPKQARQWSTRAASYPTPPGSANVYARWFLEKLFPLQESCGAMTDSYCIAAAPFLGDVQTVAKPLVSYRIHGRNQGALSRLEPRQFVRQLDRAMKRRAYAEGIAASVGIAISTLDLNRSLNFLGYRIASLRTSPQTHPIPRDSRLRALLDLCIAASTPQGAGLKTHLTMLAWGFGVCCLPLATASNLVLWRFAPTTRPRRIRLLLGKLGVLRA